MNGYLKNLTRLLPMSALVVAGWASQPTLCAADMPMQLEISGPKVTLQAGTHADADAALKAVEKMLSLWSQGQVEQASDLVSEKDREKFVKYMKSHPIVWKRVDDVFISRPKDHLLARVHATVAKQDRKSSKDSEIGIDMVFRDGRWWVIER